jgi:xanthine dehydrogenase small subunit
MRDSVRFLLGTEPRELRQFEPTMTVLDYLRRCEHRKGTKEGCAEGDCGACTVVLARPEHDRLHYEAVNSCIQFLPTLDGRQLLTIEDLKEPNGQLHPIQQALVDHHGSQCGFCTPGFVMSLFPVWRSGADPGIDELCDTLSGNLCRCTGYGPILAAAQAACGPTHASTHLLSREAGVLEGLRQLADSETIAIEHEGQRYFGPTTVDSLAELLIAYPDATLLSGGTDVGLWVTKQHRTLETVIYTGRIHELKRIEQSPNGIEIGAGVTCAAAVPVLGAEWPDMGEVFRRYASPPIRNVATIGGNIGNGSPIGDSAPMLIAAGAGLVLRRGGERRSLPLEAYFTAYGTQDRRPGEFVEKIVIPRRGADQQFRAYKISKRFDQDISAVLGAFALTLQDGHVAAVRIAFGGMAATPKRALETERMLLGRPWSRQVVERAMQALAEEYQPITDMRATGEYRLRVAQNLLLKCFVESAGGEGDTRLVLARSLAHV